MNLGRFGGAVAWLAVGVVVLSVQIGTARAQDAAIDPAALEILQRMTDYLGGLEGFDLTTDNMVEDVLVTGQKIQYDFTAEVQIRRPDKLRAERTGDLFQQLVVYDGEMLTIYNPQDRYYARAEAPGNLDDLLHFARDTLDVVPPTGDIVYTNAYELLTAAVTEGYVVGKSLVGGVRCDHLAFRTPLVDWQIWIADGELPLPYKYVLTTMDDPAYPQYMVLMSDWDVAPDTSDATFAFTAPAGAQEIEFLSMDTGHATP
jgi:hypothetical protein